MKGTKGLKVSAKGSGCLLTWLLTLAMVAGLFLPMGNVCVVQAAETVKCAVDGGDIYFDKSTGIINGSDKTVTKAVIPATIEGVAVKGIGTGAFSSHPALKEVTLPEGLETIDVAAFQYAKELEKITFPDSLKSVGDYAFRFCESLETVTYKGAMFDPFDESDDVNVDLCWLVYT